MSPLLETVLAILAVWRLAHLLARERGPADLISRLHARLAGTTAGEVLACPYCLGLWLALAPAAWLAEGWGQGLLLWWGVAGGAALIERLVQPGLA